MLSSMIPGEIIEYLDTGKVLAKGVEDEDIMARVALGLENSGVSYIRIAPGFRIPFGHRHKQQEEVYVLVSGSARVKIEEEVRDLKQWDAVRLHRDTLRGFEAGDDGAEFIAIGAPNTGPGDAEVIQEWWSD